MRQPFARRAACTALLAVTVALAGSPAAHAATLGVFQEADGSLTLEFIADPGEENVLDVGLRSGDRVQVFSGAGAPIEILTADRCEPGITDSEAFCDAPDFVYAELGDRNDRVRELDVRADLLLGPGDDEAMSGLGDDFVFGGDGNDAVDYSNTVQGENRNDTPVTVTLDGQPNDGEQDEGDNIANDVEVIEGGELADHFVGNDGGQELNGHGGDDLLEGGGGNDALSGSAGNDNLQGGAGDDALNGDADGDRIDAGSGSDEVRGDLPCTLFLCGGGADEILVRDGESDTVACGVGGDHVVADRIDVIQSDGGELCESVDLPPLPPPPPPPPAPPPPVIAPPPPVAGSGATAGTLSAVSGTALRRALASGLRFRVGCAQPCDVSAVARLDRRTARRFRLPAAVGRGTLKGLRPGQAARTLRVRFTRAAQRRLRRARRVAVTVTVTYQYAAGRATRSRKVTLKR